MVEQALTTQEQNFIENLVEGLDPKKAAEAAGFHPLYGYQLRKRLSKFIVEAAEDYLALHAVKAAKHVTDTLDAEMPNPIKLQAANSLLDRVGIIKKDTIQAPVIKANIFILPEKKTITIDQ